MHVATLLQEFINGLMQRLDRRRVRSFLRSTLTLSALRLSLLVVRGPRVQVPILSHIFA